MKDVELLRIINFILIVGIIIIIEIKINYREKYTKKELEREKQLKESLYQLNHELKNPLAVVNGYLQMIDRTKSQEKKTQYLKNIKEEVKRSITIINDFSELGKIKKLEIDIMDLTLLFQEIINILQPIYKRENSMIVFQNNEELYIVGDYERLKQVFINILKNALESKDKDFLIVEIKIRKEKSNYKIMIRDNGRGMSLKEIEQMHDIFFTTKENGSGIGLSYVKRIIDLHKGMIEFKSKEKKGSTAIITLPIKINSNNYNLLDIQDKDKQDK